MKRLLYIFVFLFMMVPFYVQARSPVKASLEAQKEGVFPNDTFYIALKLDLPKGWHTYWQNSGDSGEATEIHLTLPKGLTQVERAYPYPERFDVFSLTEYGYKNQAYVLIKLKADKDLALNQVLKIKGHATWLACKNECVPDQAHVESFLITGVPSTTLNPNVTEALALLPQPLGQPLSFWNKESDIILELPDQESFETAYFYPHDGNLIKHSGIQKIEQTTQNKYLSIPKNLKRSDPMSDQISGVLVLKSAEGVVTKAFDVKVGLSVQELPVFMKEFQFSSFATALIFSFLGGFLLNLMPCVFPILSLKAFHIAKCKAPKSDSIAYALGILVSFLLIGGMLLVLRHAGAELGWGFQLQYPPFVLAMLLLMFFLGLVFSEVATVFTSIACVGSRVSERWGSFGTGVLAVFIATPCAAPFMGTALGYGLTSPAPITLLVFLMMGFGLALPFLALGLFPSLGRFLPKSGAWLMTFRQFLAFPMYATAGWLLWLLSAQEGNIALAIGIGCVILVGFSTWLWEKSKSHTRLVFLAKSTFVVTLACIVMSLHALAPSVQQQAKLDQIIWLEYSPEQVLAYRKQNVPVFIKFSASWCLTCLVNDKVALSSHEVAQAFKSKGIVAFYADWTLRNDMISQALESYGRGGIPLYVYYAPEAKTPVFLPQIITPQMVIDLFKDLD